MNNDLMKLISQLNFTREEEENWHTLIPELTDQEKHELKALLNQMKLERDILATRQSNELVATLHSLKSEE